MTNGMMEATAEDLKQAAVSFLTLIQKVNTRVECIASTEKKSYLPDSVDEAVRFGKSIVRRPKSEYLQ